MASDSEASCVSDPNFAVICSFLERFGTSCGITIPDFLELQEMLENTQEVSPELVDIHVKLLRKVKKSVPADRWERVLTKLCHTYSSQDAWEFERFGYKKARLSSKLRTLKMLLEMQFDFNQKFKTEVNRLTVNELRTEPIGRDKHGRAYWYQLDEHCQMRVYREDPDEETWMLLVKDRESLVRLISELSSNESTNGDLTLNEDSSSLEVDKPITDTGQISSVSNSGADVDDSSTGNEDSKPIEKPEPKVEEEEKIKTSDTTETLKEEPNDKLVAEDKPIVEEKQKEEVKNDSPESSEESSGIDLSVAQGVDLSKKKSTSDLCINLRIKPLNQLCQTPVQGQLMDLSMKKHDSDPKQFSSRSVPPFKPMSTEDALQETPSSDEDVEEEEEEEEDEEEFESESDEIELPSHMKRPRLDRPTLLGNARKKTYSEEDEEGSEDEIEEPLMLIQGEGSGRECENGNMLNIDCNAAVSEAIEEPVMFVYGEGSGRDCDTGNTENEEKQSVPKKESNNASDLKSEDTSKRDFQCASDSLKTNVDANKSSDSKDTSVSVTSSKHLIMDLIDDKQASESVSKQFPKSQKIGKVMIDIKSTDRCCTSEQISLKRVSRWDIGKPQGKSEETKNSPDDLKEKFEEGISTNYSISKPLESEVRDLKLSNFPGNQIEELVNSDNVSEMDSSLCTGNVNKEKNEEFNLVSEGPVQKLISKDEQNLNEQNVNKEENICVEHSETTPKSVPVDSPKKQSQFFFGPGCFQFKSSLATTSFKGAHTSFESSVEKINSEKDLSQITNLDVSKNVVDVEEKLNNENKFSQGEESETTKCGKILETVSITETKICGENETLKELNTESSLEENVDSLTEKLSIICGTSEDLKDDNNEDVLNTKSLIPSKSDYNTTEKTTPIFEETQNDLDKSEILEEQTVETEAANSVSNAELLEKVNVLSISDVNEETTSFLKNEKLVTNDSESTEFNDVKNENNNTSVHKEKLLEEITLSSDCSNVADSALISEEHKSNTNKTEENLEIVDDFKSDVSNESKNNAEEAYLSSVSEVTDETINSKLEENSIISNISKERAPSLEFNESELNKAALSEKLDDVTIDFADNKNINITEVLEKTNLPVVSKIVEDLPPLLKDDEREVNKIIPSAEINESKMETADNEAINSTKLIENISLPTVSHSSKELLILEGDKNEAKLFVHSNELDCVEIENADSKSTDTSKLVDQVDTPTSFNVMEGVTPILEKDKNNFVEMSKSLENLREDNITATQSEIENSTELVKDSTLSLISNILDDVIPNFEETSTQANKSVSEKLDDEKSTTELLEEVNLLSVSDNVDRITSVLEENKNQVEDDLFSKKSELLEKCAPKCDVEDFSLTSEEEFLDDIETETTNNENLKSPKLSQQITSSEVTPMLKESEGNNAQYSENLVEEVNESNANQQIEETVFVEIKDSKLEANKEEKQISSPETRSEEDRIANIEDVKVKQIVSKSDGVENTQLSLIASETSFVEKLTTQDDLSISVDGSQKDSDFVKKSVLENVEQHPVTAEEFSSLENLKEQYGSSISGDDDSSSVKGLTSDKANELTVLKESGSEILEEEHKSLFSGDTEPFLLEESDKKQPAQSDEITNIVPDYSTHLVTNEMLEDEKSMEVDIDKENQEETESIVLSTSTEEDDDSQLEEVECILKQRNKSDKSMFKKSFSLGEIDLSMQDKEVVTHNLEVENISNLTKNVYDEEKDLTNSSDVYCGVEDISAESEIKINQQPNNNEEIVQAKTEELSSAANVCNEQLLTKPENAPVEIENTCTKTDLKANDNDDDMNTTISHVSDISESITKKTKELQITEKISENDAESILINSDQSNDSEPDLPEQLSVQCNIDSDSNISEKAESEITIDNKTDITNTCKEIIEAKPCEKLIENTDLITNEVQNEEIEGIEKNNRLTEEIKDVIDLTSESSTSDMADEQSDISITKKQESVNLSTCEEQSNLIEEPGNSEKMNENLPSNNNKQTEVTTSDTPEGQKSIAEKSDNVVNECNEDDDLKSHTESKNADKVENSTDEIIEKTDLTSLEEKIKSSTEELINENAEERTKDDSLNKTKEPLDIHDKNTSSVDKVNEQIDLTTCEEKTKDGTLNVGEELKSKNDNSVKEIVDLESYEEETNILSDKKSNSPVGKINVKPIEKLIEKLPLDVKELSKNDEEIKSITETSAYVIQKSDSSLKEKNVTDIFQPENLKKVKENDIPVIENESDSKQIETQNVDEGDKNEGEAMKNSSEASKKFYSIRVIPEAKMFNNEDTEHLLQPDMKSNDDCLVKGTVQSSSHKAVCDNKSDTDGSFSDDNTMDNTMDLTTIDSEDSEENELNQVKQVSAKSAQDAEINENLLNLNLKGITIKRVVKNDKEKSTEVIKDIPLTKAECTKFVDKLKPQQLVEIATSKSDNVILMQNSLKTENKNVEIKPAEVQKSISVDSTIIPPIRRRPGPKFTKERRPPVMEIPKETKTEEPKSAVKCVDVSKLQKVSIEPDVEIISISKKISLLPVKTTSVDEKSSEVTLIPETDPLACTEDDIPLIQRSANFNRSLSLATFKMEENETDTSLLPEPIARALRNRSIAYSAAAKKPGLKRGRPCKIVENDASSKKRICLEEQTDVNAESKQKTVSSIEEDNSVLKEIEITHQVVPVSPMPQRGTGKARRGRPRTVNLAVRPPESISAVTIEPPKLDISQPVSTTPSPTTEAISTTKKRKRVRGLHIDPSLIISASKQSEEIEVNNRGTVVRQSRRIAQIKIKEEAERRKIEELTLVELREEQKKKKTKKHEDEDFQVDKKKKKQKQTTEEENETEEEPVLLSKHKKHKKKRKHQDLKKLFNVTNPWQSSSGSSTSNEEEEEEEEEVEESDDGRAVLKSDHEFSPESDLESNAEVQPLRRARTVKKESDTEEPTDEHACQKCCKADHPEWILLCDKCDCGWHCSCLRPPLLVIPEGDWFCPPCQHISLIEALKLQLIEYDKKVNRRDIEIRRKQRLAYVGISLDNVLPSKELEGGNRVEREDHKSEESTEDSSDSDSSSGSSSSDDDSEPIYQLRQRRQAHSYRFNDYDELINSAIQEELEAVKGAGNQGRGKDIATIVNAEKEEAKAQALLEQQRLQNEEPAFEVTPPVVPMPEIEQQIPSAAEQVSEEETDEKPPVVPRHIGRKKHRKLNCLDVSSEDDPVDDEDFKGSSATDEEDLDDVASADSDDSELSFRGNRKRSAPTRRSTRARIARYDRDFINDDSEEEIARRKKSKSIWNESESEESDKSWGRRKRKKKQHLSTTSSSSKKSRKKKRRRNDSDSEVYRSRKFKKPVIKYGGLDDSDEELLIRRTRGKKINYIDALGTDSEDEKPSTKQIESEEEYVANEDEEEDQDDIEDVHEKEAESETVADKSPVIPKKIIKLPKLKSPRARGRGKAGISRALMQRIATASAMTSEPEAVKISQEQDEINKTPIDIPVIAANPEDLNEEEVGTMMMENEEYANKQLELMAIQLAKEKRKKEMEQQLADTASTANVDQDNQSFELKKRGRKKKLLDDNFVETPQQNAEDVNQDPVFTQQASSQFSENVNESFAQNMPSNFDPDVSNEDFASSLAVSPAVPTVITDQTPSPPKRRGRGKGKKTLAAEAAAAAAAIPTVSPSSSVTTPVSPASNVSASESIPPVANEPCGSMSPEPNLQCGKLGIAPPPQPFSQSQPVPSVITRMLQSQPMPPSALGQKYFEPSPRGQFPQMNSKGATPYRQSPTNLNMFLNSPHRLRSPGPPNISQMYHSTHHSMDPSPSGGGPINIADRNSPALAPPPASSPSESTPPPPPYTRTPISTIRFQRNESSPGPSLSARHHLQFPAPGAHMQQASPPSRAPPPGNFSPYHPPPPPSYHYGAYPPAPALTAADDALPPTDYQGSPYPDHYNAGDAAIHSSEGSNSKPFDEEGSGEFGGLVSYFSSQREDDLDT